MSSNYRNLALYPALFGEAVVLAVVFTAQPLLCVISLVLLTEALFSWEKVWSLDVSADFRVSFSSHYLWYLYVLGIFLATLLGAFLIPLIYWWSLLLYAANFIAFRSFGAAWTGYIANPSFPQSSSVSNSFDRWTLNKQRLLVLVQDSTLDFPPGFLDQMETSSFLRTEQASVLIEKAEHASGQDRQQLVDQISSYL